MAGPSLKDTMPLYNGDAEQACLGALLIDPESINSVLKYLRSESFYEPANQEVFEALLAMHEKGQKPDLITLSEELRSRGSLDRVGGSAYVASLASFTPSAANVEYYAKIVQEMATRRRLIQLSSEMAAVAHEETMASTRSRDRRPRFSRYPERSANTTRPKSRTNMCYRKAGTPRPLQACLRPDQSMRMRRFRIGFIVIGASLRGETASPDDSAKRR